jgi:predicted lipoprotein with Yx(FWY)xxD motif
LSAGLLAIALVTLLGLMACTSASTTTATTTTATTSPVTTPTTTTTTSADTVNIMHNATLGDYLVDGNGMTLYHFTKDSPGVSNATAAIIALWPVFYASTITTSSAALNPADFGSITRSDGSMQTTFRGYPLYYYINDKAPGDTNGQGINNIWFVVNPVNFPPTTTTTSSTTTTTGY